MPGTFSRSILKNAEAGTIDRVQVSAKFAEVKGPLALEPVASEEDLADRLNGEQMSVTVRIRVPRIATGVGYWPPTERAVQKAKALFEAGKPLTFEDMESSNIANAWLFDRKPR